MSKSKIPKGIRALVANRAKWRCEYCVSQERFAPQSFTIDHFVPQSKGGNDDMENLVNACQGCNGAKSDKIGMVDPITRIFVPFFNPRTQVWEEHFGWNDDYTHIIGRTAVGRVTVLALGLNRQILLELRAFLYRLGEHPPGD